MSKRLRKLNGFREREIAFQIVYAADMAGTSPLEMVEPYAERFVAPPVEKGPDQKSQWFEVEAFEDSLPDPETWDALHAGVLILIESLVREDVRISELLRTASPRWRQDRMPAVDRSLLRLGIAEMLGSGSPPTRDLIHSQIELAKRYGGDTSHRFVNGILDQVRRDLDLPFA